MQLDKQRLSLLLALPDEALKAVLSDIAKDAGIDPKALGLDLNQLAKVRAALSSMTDADLAAIAHLLEERKTQGRG